MTGEPRGTYLASVESFALLVEQIQPDQWDRPGLGVWDVRALVGHTSRSLVTVLAYLDQPAEHEELPTPADYYLRIAALAVDPDAVAERGRVAGAALGADPAHAVRDLQASVVRRLAAVDLDGLVTTLVGGMRVRNYLPTRTFELVVHGLDIAAATGQAAPQSTAHAVHLAANIAVRAGHGPAVLRALTGRTPLPDGFSVV